MTKTKRAAVVMSLAALALAGCSERPDDKADDPKPTASSTVDNTDFKACMVSDSGGFDDKSFNETSHDGLIDAKNNLNVSTAEVESASDTEYADNIAQLVKAGCNEITTVGFLLGEATEKAAKANPDVDFAIVDFGFAKPTANLKGLTFNTAEPSYLAGYLAAAKSESGIVGTFGGLNIPTVTIFMEGFRKGIEAFNADNDGEDVKLIGWNGKSGSFTEDFEDKAKGKATGEELISQGADIIFPVAGPAGLGGLQAAKDADVKAIWVDTDGCESAAEYCDILLTSVVKGMDVAVEEGIKASLEDTFTNELFVGTLANDGVGLAPFHEAEGDIDDELKAKIESLREEIVSGKLKVS